MKILTALYFFLIVSLSSACKEEPKVIPNSLPHVFKNSGFELTRNGLSLITSTKDSVKISYEQGGVTKFQSLSVIKLQASATDTTSIKKYNGLVITDNQLIEQLSAGEISPIHSFTIYLNDVKMGIIYFDKTVMTNTTFDHTPVNTDAIGYYASNTQHPMTPLFILPVN